MDPLFEKRMKEMLKEEMEAYSESLERPLFQGLRISGRKQDVTKTKQELPFLGSPSGFARNTWYIQGQYGLHPAHLQGLFYLQEPSASSAAQALDVRPSDYVLDLCAAPGSKSTQILDALEDGFLLSNEIDPRRAQILLSNMERMGAENFMVTNAEPEKLCSQLPEFFDRVLVDAPCSGEGMMKKHAAAMEQWSYPNILLCAARQKDILREAWKALKPGGQLVYSTCTYAKEENEDNAAWLLKTFPDARQLDIPGNWGRSGFETEGLDAAKVRRIFPMDGGEGHFIARFEKALPSEEDGSSSGSSVLQKKRLSEGSGSRLSADLSRELFSFLKGQLEPGYSFYHSEPSQQGVRIYGMNVPFLKLKNIRILRQGVLIGESLKKRFEPAHAFYLSRSMARNGLSKTETDLKEMDAFYHGEQLSLQAPAGYRALCYKGIPYGFGKSSQKRITNKLPKGLRLNPGSHIHEAQSSETEEEPEQPWKSSPKNS